MTADVYRSLRRRLKSAGYGHEYEWSQGLKAPSNAVDFFFEYGWVVVNSGMRNQVAAVIWKRIISALADGQPVVSAFKHPGKAAAIQHVWDNREFYFEAYLVVEDAVEFCASLPWIGPITKWHLAKNFGVDCAKPDRHLVRLASLEGTTAEGLCERLAAETGDRIATVDLVLWRAANLGWI